MSGYQTVVVGTDGSDSSLRAVDRAGADRRRVGRQADRGDGVLPPERGPACRRRPQGRGLQDVRQCPDLRDPARGQGARQGRRAPTTSRRRPSSARPSMHWSNSPRRSTPICSSSATSGSSTIAGRLLGLGARERGAPLQDRRPDRPHVLTVGTRYQPIDPGMPLNGPCHPAGDPAAVEPAGLGFDLLAVDGAAVDLRGHHRDRSGDGLETGCRGRIRPPGALGHPGCGDQVEVAGPALPLTPRRTGRVAQHAVGECRSGQVVRRGMTGLQYPPGAVGRRDRLATEFDR